MKHTNEEIINALKVIKDECLSCNGDSRYEDSCFGCCFYNHKIGCVIHEYLPCSWSIINEKEEVWRALK